jgi:hypothetical protein
MGDFKDILGYQLYFFGKGVKASPESEVDFNDSWIAEFALFFFFSLTQS